MRPSFLLLPFALTIASGCALWDPDHVPDPDQSLRDLLDTVDSNEQKLNPVVKKRLAFAVARLATQHPTHVPSLVAAGALALDSSQSHRAQGFVDRALELEPDNVEARGLRVRIAIADGSLDLARKTIEDGLRLRPDASELYESSAWLHQLNNRPLDALRALKAAEALKAPKWRIAFNRGLIEELRGNHDAAAEYYRAALKENNACSQARHRLGGITAKRAIGPVR